MSKVNLGGIIIENFEPQKQIEIVIKKGLTSKRLIVDSEGIHIPKKDIHIKVDLLLNEKPPVVAFINTDSNQSKDQVTLLVHYFNGKKWNEFLNLKKTKKEAEDIAMKLNERFATIHFS